MEPIVERWLPVVGFEGFFEVSNLGRVKSLSRLIEQGNQWGSVTRYTQPEKILTPCGDPYLLVRLRPSPKTHRVHVLVAHAFLGPCPGVYGRGRGKWEIDHIDGNKKNNQAANLQWLPHRINAYVKSGLQHGVDGRFLSLR